MKRTKYFLAATILLVSTSLYATTRVVNNSNANPGQFYYLQAAIDSSSNGDTLMIQPSANNYGNVVLDKSLTLIGIGHKPVKDLPLVASITSITMGQYTTGMTLIGLKISQFLTPCNAYGNWSYNSGITIRNCQLDYFGTNNPNNCYGFNSMSDIVVENCFLKGFGLSNTGNNALIQNCIFEAYGASFGDGVTNVVVKNNLFMYESLVGNLSANGAIFENNIFFRFSPSSSYGSLNNCVFNNNLTYQTNNDVIVGGTNTGSNNIIGQDPLFVDLNYSSTPLYKPTLYNFRLQELSPGHNAGIDGQDVGPYGNSSTYSETGESNDRPVIRVMNLTNSTVPSGAVLNVHLKATPSRND